jgi:hypothetical protein
LIAILAKEQIDSGSGIDVTNPMMCELRVDAAGRHHHEKMTLQNEKVLPWYSHKEKNLDLEHIKPKPLFSTCTRFRNERHEAIHQIHPLSLPFGCID